MGAIPLRIIASGLITSVGLSAAATCAAIRARVTNPSETRFKSADGAWIQAHCVPLDGAPRGRAKLVAMASAAAAEALASVPAEDWTEIPILLCASEPERPGRFDGIDDLLLSELQEELGVEFAATSCLIAQGRTSIGTALLRARELLSDAALVLVVATDSLVTWPTLSEYERSRRLLTATNSNGFMAGEAAGAVLLARGSQNADLVCAGIGLCDEPAPLGSGEPLRGDGLTRAIRLALNEADCHLHDLDYRVTDLSGEQYYFKEAALALNRILRVRKEDFQIWHPAEFVGEVGAASGPICLALAASASRKAFAPGRGVLLHFASDSGVRVGIVALSS